MDEELSSLHAELIEIRSKFSDDIRDVKTKVDTNAAQLQDLRSELSSVVSTALASALPSALSAALPSVLSPLVSPVLCVRPHNSSIDLAGFGCLLPRPVSVSMFRISLRGKVPDRSRRQEELQLARVNKLIGSRWSFAASLPSSRSSWVPRLANRWQWSLGVHHQQQIYPT